MDFTRPGRLLPASGWPAQPKAGEPLAGLPAANSLNIDHLPLLISSLMQP